MSEHILDEHFVPEPGLDLEGYIERGDVSGVHHLLRYQWALMVIGDVQPLNNALDIACGSGYGSYMIAKRFPNTHVVGADYDSLAIDEARKRYSLPNLEYRIGDLTLWDDTVGKEMFDCVISFDTIEHISHREITMQNLVEHLQKDGSLLLSTPCGTANPNLYPEWKHHKIEYSAASLYDFLRRYFLIILRPDDNSLPHKGVFDCLKGSNVDYLLRMNPVLCKDPVTVTNPYRPS